MRCNIILVKYSFMCCRKIYRPLNRKYISQLKIRLGKGKLGNGPRISRKWIFPRALALAWRSAPYIPPGPVSGSGTRAYFFSIRPGPVFTFIIRQSPEFMAKNSIIKLHETPIPAGG